MPTNFYDENSDRGEIRSEPAHAIERQPGDDIYIEDVEEARLESATDNVNANIAEIAAKKAHEKSGAKEPKKSAAKKTAAKKSTSAKK